MLLFKRRAVRRITKHAATAWQRFITRQMHATVRAAEHVLRWQLFGRRRLRVTTAFKAIAQQKKQATHRQHQ
jgi:hypothetical protein